MISKSRDFPLYVEHDKEGSDEKDADCSNGIGSGAFIFSCYGGDQFMGSTANDLAYSSYVINWDGTGLRRFYYTGASAAVTLSLCLIAAAAFAVEDGAYAIIAPNGGEVYHPADTMHISWKLNSSTSLNHWAVLKMSVDGGLSYSIPVFDNGIRTDLTQIDTFWIIPDDTSLYTAAGKLWIAPYNQYSGYDESDGFFRIEPTSGVQRQDSRQGSGSAARGLQVMAVLEAGRIRGCGAGWQLFANGKIRNLRRDDSFPLCGMDSGWLVRCFFLPGGSPAGLSTSPPAVPAGTLIR